MAFPWLAAKCWIRIQYLPDLPAGDHEGGHVGAVGGLKLRWMDRALRITPVPVRSDAPLRLECWGAHRKSGLLAAVIGKPVEIVTPEGAALSSTTIEEAVAGA